MFCRQMCENAIEAAALLSCECIGNYGTIRMILFEGSGEVVSTPVSYLEGPGFNLGQKTVILTAAVRDFSQFPQLTVGTVAQIRTGTLLPLLF